VGKKTKTLNWQNRLPTAFKLQWSSNIHRKLSSHLRSDRCFSCELMKTQVPTPLFSNETRDSVVWSTKMVTIIIENGTESVETACRNYCFRSGHTYPYLTRSSCLCRFPTGFSCFNLFQHFDNGGRENYV
jgi:hypothetical protein